ncbi:phage tail tape measure protein, partial [Yersinia enterocolitica]
LTGSYQPVSTNNRVAVQDNSTHETHLVFPIPPGTSPQEVQRLVTTEMAKQAREHRTRQRSQMEN